MDTEYQKYELWLKTLKVNDTIIIDRGVTIGLRYKVGTITKITPTGMIQIDGEEPKFKNGSTPYSRYSNGKQICEPTEKLKEEAFRERMIGKLENMKFKDVTTEKLREIQKILEV